MYMTVLFAQGHFGIGVLLALVESCPNLRRLTVPDINPAEKAQAVAYCRAHNLDVAF